MRAVYSEVVKIKHLGDITKINGAAVPPVEVIIGGSPCQDLSVAGKRAGLGGVVLGDRRVPNSSNENTISRRNIKEQNNG